MKYFLSLTAVLALIFFAAPVLDNAYAEETEASVTISSPADGAKIAAGKSFIIKYEVVPGSKGDHLHLVLDGKMSGLLKEFKGSHDLGALPAGSHTLKIVIMNVSHYPTGVEGSVTFNVE